MGAAYAIRMGVMLQTGFSAGLGVWVTVQELSFGGAPPGVGAALSAPSRTAAAAAEAARANVDTSPAATSSSFSFGGLDGGDADDVQATPGLGAKAAGGEGVPAAWPC